MFNATGLPYHKGRWTMKKITLLVFVCFALLFSCGPKQVAVKYADTFIQRQVEKRLPLYDAQEDALSRDIDRFLNEEKERVKSIVPLLNKINLDDPMTLDQQYPKITDAYLEIAYDFSKILARHMSSFDEKQIKDFLKRMREENNSIFLKDREERREKIEARVRHLLGTLSDEQKKILHENGKIFDAQIVRRSERRARLHTLFKNILEQEISREAKEKMIYEAFVNYQKEALESTENLEIAKKIFPTLSAAQKKNVKGHLAEIGEIVDYFLKTTY